MVTIEEVRQSLIRANEKTIDDGLKAVGEVYIQNTFPNLIEKYRKAGFKVEHDGNWYRISIKLS